MDDVFYQLIYDKRIWDMKKVKKEMKEYVKKPIEITETDCEITITFIDQNKIRDVYRSALSHMDEGVDVFKGKLK